MAAIFLKLFSGTAMIYDRRVMEMLDSATALAGLQHAGIRVLAAEGTVKHLAPTEVLFERDSQSTGGVLILSGHLELVANIGNRRRYRKLIGPGEICGIRNLIIAGKWHVSARAQDELSVLEIRRSSFVRVMRQSPIFSARYLRLIREADAPLAAGALQVAQSADTAKRALATYQAAHQPGSPDPMIARSTSTTNIGH